MHLPSVPGTQCGNSPVMRPLLHKKAPTGQEKWTFIVLPALDTNQCHSQYRHGNTEA